MKTLLSTHSTLLSGVHFDLMCPDASMITFDDVAVPLCHIPRFGGQLPLGQFYSVAQHSVNVSLLVPEDLALEGLMHDASEAFIGDILSPLKRAIGPAIKDIESRIEVELAKRFGFRFPFDPAIKLADLQMLGLETTFVRGMVAETCTLLDGIEFKHLRDQVHLTPLPPPEAYVLFLERYEELTR